MSKIIVYHPDDWTNLNAPHLEPIWNKFFKLEAYDKNQIYDPKIHIFWSGHLFADHWYKEFHNNGFRIIIDHLWDSDLSQISTVSNNVLILRCKNYVWYNESLWYKDLGFDQYSPNRTKQNSFLMLMNLSKPHRDKILERINLNEALYSYIEKNIFIDNDVEHTGHWQRHFCPVWYNNTSFSVVVETQTDLPTFISEKTFKPIAYYHPFIVWGSPFTLQYLHELGFETFSHIIDESYDDMLDDKKRLSAVCFEIDKLLLDYKTVFDNKQTQDILKHNHNLFFHSSIVQRFEEEIVGEVSKFIMQ